MKLPFLSKARPAFPTAADFGYLELRGGTTRVVIVPSLGGKLTELVMGGRQWLWASDVVPLSRGIDGTSYLESGDSGGFDECFPTISACRVPGWVRAFGGVELPDHGELWSQEPELAVRTDPDGQHAILTWRGVRFPYRLQRDIAVAPDGSVRMDYVLVNDGTERIPFLWSAHPMFPLSNETRLELPDGARLRVFARHEIELGEVRSEHRWPFIRGSGKVYDFSHPSAVAKRYACKLFLDMPEGWATLREGSHELAMRFDPTLVTHVGVWLNKRGWTPFRREEPYMNLSLAPCLGAPDALSDALGDWKSAAWVEPGGERRWWVSYEARTVATEGHDGAS